MRGILQDKAALVTGAASGIGRASAITFAREGAKVVIADIDTEMGNETMQMIKKAGGEALFIKVDVAKASEIEALVNKTLEAYGRLDCAHNNAGIVQLPTHCHECTEEEFDRIINVNLKGIWLCMKYEIKHMINHGGGAIVNTSSVGGVNGNPMISIYSASKHGVIGLTKSAAAEYANVGIRVNAVCPGVIQNTRMAQRVEDSDPGFASNMARLPMGRGGEPQEVAEAAVWLCSNAASYITGHPLVVDGGFLSRC